MDANNAHHHLKRPRSQMTMCYDYPSVNAKRPRPAATPSPLSPPAPHIPYPSSSSTIVLDEDAHTHSRNSQSHHVAPIDALVHTDRQHYYATYEPQPHLQVVTYPPNVSIEPTYISQPSQQQQQQQQHQIHILNNIQFHPSPPPPPPPPPLLRPADPFGEHRLRSDVHASFSRPGKHNTTHEWTESSLVSILTSELSSIISSSSSSSSSASPVSAHCFYSQTRQPFDLRFYVERLVTYANCSGAAFIVTLAYVDRVQQVDGVNEMNCHRILLAALVLAIKFVDDEVFSNAHYACVGGVDPAEMNDLETALLKLLDWQLYVSPEMFRFYETSLLTKLDQPQPTQTLPLPLPLPQSQSQSQVLASSEDRDPPDSPAYSPQLSNPCPPQLNNNSNHTHNNNRNSNANDNGNGNANGNNAVRSETVFVNTTPSPQPSPCTVSPYTVSPSF